MNEWSYSVKQCSLWIGPRIFLSRKQGFLSLWSSTLTPLLGSSFIANFLLAIKGPCGVVTCSRGSQEVTTGSYPFKVGEWGREQHVPESSNHALFPENEGNFVENQLLDGSIGLSPLCRRRTICPSISQRDFARDSPDFAFFRHFSRVFPHVALTQTTLKITVSGRCACVCACVWL